MNFETVIGLEIHVQLGTASKAFCGDSTTFGAAPNTQISIVSLGYPGTLPYLNERVVECAVRLGCALQCTINQASTFERKNYFYPDSPKGYQITQNENPICIGGKLRFRVGDGAHEIRLHHIHIEEDAGKLIHDLAPDASCIDLNRAGVPLLEIVTEPDFRSSEQVVAFLTELQKIVRFTGVSDGNMEEGAMRCDCNVSVRRVGAAEFGQRCEVKNVNSMRNARRAINYEAARQIAIIENGGGIAQETRSFDAQNGTTSALRSKEDAHDYRYFPEPDLPPVRLSEAYIDAINKALPELPSARFERYCHDLNLSAYEANLLSSDIDISAYFEAMLSHNLAAKTAANWLLNAVTAFLNANNINIQNFGIQAITLVELIKNVENNTINKNIAESKLLPKLHQNQRSTVAEWIVKLGLSQTKNDTDITTVLEAILVKYPQKVAEYKKGKKGLSGFFLGEAMKITKGKMDAKAAAKVLDDLLL